jgi:DNA-binding transcriptional LysR family regulator
MLPTTKALALEKPLLELFGKIEAIYRKPEMFNPSHAKGTVRIATTDYFEQVVWVHLLGDLTREAPGLRFVTVMTGSELPVEAMRDGSLQLAIAGFFGELPNGFMRQSLYSDHFVTVVRQDHPYAKRELSLEKYLEFSHLLVSPRGDGIGAVEAELQRKKKQRHIAASVSSFLTSGPVVANSDLALTAPSKLVDRFVSHLPLRTYQPPISLPKINIVQVWHERYHQDPMLVWLRKAIYEACQRI